MTLLQRITSGMPIDPSTLATYFWEGLHSEIKDRMVGFVDPITLMDTNRLYPLAAHVELSLKTVKMQELQQQGMGQSQPQQQPRSGKKTQQDRPQGQQPEGKRQRFSTPSYNFGQYKGPCGLAPGEPQHGFEEFAEPHPHGWPTLDEMARNRQRWAGEGRCTVCGSPFHQAANCRSPNVRSNPIPREITGLQAADDFHDAMSAELNPVELPDIATVDLTNLFTAQVHLLGTETETKSDKKSRLKMLFSGMFTEGPQSRQTEEAWGQQARQGPRPRLNEDFHVLCADASVLVDTGANANFITENVVQKLGIQVEVDSSPRLAKSVRLADGHTIRPSGHCILTTRIGDYTEDLEFVVLRMSNPVFQAILGSDWCVDHGAALLFHEDKCIIHVNSKQIELHTEIPHAEHDIPCAPVELLTAMQFRRQAHTFDHIFLVTVEDITVENEPEQTEQLREILQLYKDVFRDELPEGLPPERTTFHSIPLKEGSVPPARRMYRLSRLEAEEVKRQVLSLLQKGLIQPSSSPYGAPVLFAPKPDGTLRMCIDYRALNKQTIKNRYPLPRIDDLLDKLHGAKYFSSLDLTQAYYQVRLKPEDVPKTAFTTPDGLYEFKVLCFGLSNAPATFQTIVNTIFSDCVGKFLLAYLDDLMIYSKTLEEHYSHLKIVLSRLREHQFYAKLKKCHFLQKKVKFLGHLISVDGIQPDPAKTELVQSWPVPRNAHDVQRFLGLINYFRRFILGFAVLAKPLTDLLRAQKQFAWTDQAEQSFNRLKRALMTAPVLVMPDLEQPFELVCDACKVGIGAVLLQGGRPVAFEGRKLSPAEQNYHTGEQELLAVVYALHKYRCYLEGSHFTLVTDHLPNTSLSGKALSPQKVRWMEFISRFNFTWVYRPGRINVADPLSRAPHLPEMTEPQPDTLGSALLIEYQIADMVYRVNDLVLASVTDIHNYDIWKKGYSEDQWFDEETIRGLCEADGLWFTDENQLVVPDYQGLRQSILKEMHDTTYSGHPGIARTEKLILKNFWWPTLKEDVSTYVQACPVCQRDKPRTQRSPGLLTPLQIPKERWISVSMDFITQLPMTQVTLLYL